MIAMATNRGHKVHALVGFAHDAERVGVPHCGGFVPHPNGNAVGSHCPNGNVVGVFDAGPSFADRPPLKCQICRRNGHSTIDCYNHMNTSSEGRVPSARLTTLTAQSHHVGQAPTTPTSWLLDFTSPTILVNSSIHKSTQA
ncbi:hypothetical protein ACFX1S_018640 [Malus domestica]